MHNDAAIAVKHKHSNLHLYIKGEYSTETALKSAGIISRERSEKGNVFVHTEKISSILPYAKELFSDLVGILSLPKKSIYFTGVVGMQLCHNGGRVILVDRKRNVSKRKKKCISCRKKQSENN